MSKNIQKHKQLPTNEEIVAAWDEIEDINPDISTEKLFALVRDTFDGKIDNGDIATALYEHEKRTRNDNSKAKTKAKSAACE